MARSVVALLGLLAACKAPAPEEGSQRAALERTVEQVILPTYRELDARAGELSAALDALGPHSSSLDLARLREAYWELRAPLETADAFAFGPAVELGSPTVLDYFPIGASEIDAVLAGTAALTPAYLSSLRPSARGLHGIEYLLFPDDDLQRELALLDGGVAGARRRQYLAAAGQLVAAGARELYQAWAPEGGAYGRRFAEPGKPDSVLATAQAGIDLLLMESVFLSELIADAKLGRPRRRASAPVPRESELSGTPLVDVRANVRGMRSVYEGARDGSAGPSISSLVHAKRPDTDARVLAAFDAIELAVAALPDTSPGEASADVRSLDTAFEAFKHLKRLLATEVLGALGSSLALDINDGD